MPYANAFNPLMNALKPLRILNPFAGMQPGFANPQPNPGETPFEYQYRQMINRAGNTFDSGAQQIGNAAINEAKTAANYFYGNEQQNQQQRAQAKAKASPSPTAASVFPTSFNDPKWDELEARYGALAPMLKAIRTQGERTNMGPQGDPRFQNPRTGAYTPYQITADTRKLFQKNKGFDPWANPENAVAAAAQVLMDHGGATNPQAAVAGYFGGARAAANPFSTSMGDGNMNVAQYVNNVLYGGHGQPGALQSPFDPRYLNAAVGQIDRSTQAQMTPTKSVFGGEPMPQEPEPTPIPKTDFSQADAALEQLRPIEFTEKEAKALHWSNFWKGLGEAMARSPEGEGLGSLFLRMGGGALMAKGKTGDDIQARKDDYDNKLAKFNAAVYEHDMAKAQVMHNELIADWQSNQNWIQRKYQTALSNWQQNTKVQLVGNQLVNQHTDPKTGEVTVTTTPVSSLIMADDARDKANLAMQAFGTQNAANAQVTGIGNRIQGQIVLGQAAQALAGDGSHAERDAAAAFGPLPAIKYAVDTGQVASVIGEDEMKSLNEDVVKTLAGSGYMPGSKEYQSAYREAVIGRMLAVTMQSPDMMKRFNDTFGSAAGIYNSYNRSINTKNTERTQTKAGSTTYTSTSQSDDE